MSTTIEGFGSTSLVQVGSNYFLQPNGGLAVELSLGGAPVVAGQFGQWTPIGVEQTASGYEVVWKMTGADQYQAWNTDSSGNGVSVALDVVSGSSAALQSLETSFQQDLNGDGSIGPVAAPPPPPAGGASTVIEAFGSTSLVEIGNNYFLQPNGGSAVELSLGGAPVVAGQFGQWAPIGVEQTASGYEVVWKMTGADQYQAWNTDSSGNGISSALDVVSGSSAALQSLETSFQQDLNGDGSTGPGAAPPPPPPPPAGGASTVIEAFGSTSLVEIGNNYFLQPNGGTAVELSLGGAPVTTGQFGQWTPIGVEQTSSGFEVVWKMTGADQYQAWNTDSNGNGISGAFGVVSGTDPAVQSLETTFHQDLNGDGSIGPTAAPPPPPTGGTSTVIEAFGSTSLVEVGNNYFLQPNGGSAVELSLGGAPVVAGQFGQWAPIGAEQTASGYEVVWKMTGADQYQAWNTDSSGNGISSALDVVSGTSAALQSLETTFHQDLNGDGSVGPAAAPPPQVSSPHFVYQGVDADGAQLYDVTWDTPGSQPFAVRVLAPEHPSTSYSHTFLYALPVEPGLAQSTYGSGLDELQKLDVQDKYNATIIEPIFPIYPWYADSSTDATINYETFMSTVLPAWVDSNFDPSGTDKDLLIGLSKSGYGALDLLLKHSSVFADAAAWDFPADMAYNEYGAGDLDYGTSTNFQDNYQLNSTFIDTWKAPFTTQDRIWISGSDVFQSQVSDFDTLLTSHGVLHTLSPETNVAHTWSGGWLSDAVAGLYGLVDGSTGPGAAPPPPPPPPAGGASTVIEAFGSTSLVEIGNNYFLQPNGGTAVELSLGGAPVTAGQFGQWTPIGVEQTSSGFEVVWKMTGADQYQAWNTDSNGNGISGAFGVVSGTDPAVQSLETTFHQDLNGDGSIGPTAAPPPPPTGGTSTVIEAFGSTSLVEVGNNYFLQPNSGSAVELSLGGAPVTDGQFGQWAPIGVEQTSSGYEVVWKVTGADQYQAWNTDSNGNGNSVALGVVSGTDPGLQSLETALHQDLNGDGYTGLVLNGSSGGQTLTAGNNPTTLIGGPSDILNGGGGADTFVFKTDFGANTVNNFTPGTDMLQFSQSMFSSAAAVLSDAQQVGSDVVITHDALDVVTLHNMQLANLHASDFHIV